MFEASTVQAKTKESPAVRIRRLTEQLCNGVGFEKAEDAIAKAIADDPELIAEAIRATAHREVHYLMHQRRGRIQDPTQKQAGPPKTYSDETQRRCEEWAGRYLNWPMSSRKTLGQSTEPEVAEEAKMYKAKADGNARAERFMRLVAQRMKTLKAKPGETVSKVLDHRALERLMEKAKKE